MTAGTNEYSYEHVRVKKKVTFYSHT